MTATRGWGRLPEDLMSKLSPGVTQVTGRGPPCAQALHEEPGAPESRTFLLVVVLAGGRSVGAMAGKGLGTICRVSC